MTLNEKCPLGVHEDGAIECACESIPMPSTPIQQREECPMKGRMCQCSSDEICHHNKHVDSDISENYQKTNISDTITKE